MKKIQYSNKRFHTYAQLGYYTFHRLLFDYDRKELLVRLSVFTEALSL